MVGHDGGDLAMRIVVLDGATLNPGDNPWMDLERLGSLTVHERTELDQLLERAAEAEVLVVNKFRLDADAFAKLPTLRMVAVTATGYDCVDVGAARQRGIAVSNVPVYGTDSVAQHIIAMLLHVIHRIDVHDAAIRSGEWQACGNFSFWRSPLVELAGRTFGIVGFGRIGRAVGQIASALGMRVVIHTRTTPDDLPQGVQLATLDELWSGSDVVSLNCPLTDATHNMINRESLGRFQKHAILLNASRGGLVDEGALAESLNEGRLAAACLDVASQEPINDDNPLLRAQNCFLTPHMAWATIEARRRLMHVTVENVRAFQQNRPQNVVS